ncbi:MAG: DNA polymerase Y family protein [Rhizobiales bacterium]|nr:DNA polymerase Y family protein [Hyphomicrobiales bacterium]
MDRFFRSLSRSGMAPAACRALRGRALVLAAPVQGGLRIMALTQAAAAKGITAGQSIADALALYPALEVRDADFAGDRAALKRLSDWCGRYTPWTAPDDCGVGAEPDGIFMDITGCTHLFDGEEALAHDLVARLAGFNIRARIAIAATPGTAWALARFCESGVTILPPGQEEKALAPLPLAALRLDHEAIDGLARLGLKRIGDLYGRARAPLAARFGRSVSLRLDAALGSAAEPISPERPLVPYRARLLFAEGLTRMEDVEVAIERLADELCVLLERYQKGARQLELMLFRVDGDVTVLRAGTSAPSRLAPHLARLFHEKLRQTSDDVDTGFGIEAMSLSALAVDPLTQTQKAMMGPSTREHDIEGLMDRLGNRLGAHRITRLQPHASHLPERAGHRMTIMQAGKPMPLPDWRVAALPQFDGVAARPLRMLPAPELIEVTAEIPEGPPRRFRWRRVLYQVTRAEGPERIAPEWWRREGGRTRDYYRVEDSDGRRFWLYRDGLYNRDTEMPRWYIQGLFG